jgi:hypothetical protein
LAHLVEHKRPSKEVRDGLIKVNNAFENLVAKHELYTALLTNADFKHAIETRYSKRDSITLLRTCLKEKPLELIKGIGLDYDAAWEYLDSIYGDARFVSDTITQDIVKFKALQDGEDARFCDLVHLVKRCYNTLKEIGIPSDMDNSHMLSIIEQKMCADDRKVWSRDLEREKKPATLHKLDDYRDEVTNASHSPSKKHLK